MVIDAEKASYKIAWMCQLPGVPRSSFYARRNRGLDSRRGPPSGTSRAGHGQGTYGCRRVTAQLNRDGHPCSIDLVADLMRDLGLKACQSRAWRRRSVMLILRSGIGATSAHS